MNVYEAIRTRKSVRSYEKREVPRETILKILEAARLAPSASNRQEWRFVVVTEDALRNRMAAAARNQSFVGEAPVVIACCAETDGHLMPCGLPSFPIDVAIAIDHITLAAVSEGLGCCWIGAFDENEVKEILGIPEQGVRVVELLTMGFPADPSPVPKNRRALEEIVHFQAWKRG